MKQIKNSRRFELPIPAGTLSEINPTLCYGTLKFSSMITIFQTFQNAKTSIYEYVCSSVRMFLRVSQKTEQKSLKSESVLWLRKVEKS